MLGGVLLALTYVASLPGAVVAIGFVLFLAGIVLVAIGAGFKTAWSAFWSLFP